MVRSLHLSLSHFLVPALEKVQSSMTPSQIAPWPSTCTDLLALARVWGLGFRVQGLGFVVQEWVLCWGYIRAILEFSG